MSSIIPSPLRLLKMSGCFTLVVLSQHCLLCSRYRGLCARLVRPQAPFGTCSDSSVGACGRDGCIDVWRRIATCICALQLAPPRWNIRGLPTNPSTGRHLRKPACDAHVVALDITPPYVLDITSMTSPLSDSRYMLVIHNSKSSFASIGSPEIQEIQETREDPCGSDPSRAEDRHACRAQPERPQTPRSVFSCGNKHPRHGGAGGEPQEDPCHSSLRSWPLGHRQTAYHCAQISPLAKASPILTSTIHQSARPWMKSSRS